MHILLLWLLNSRKGGNLMCLG